MIISVNWLKQFTQIDMGIGELADIIGSRLVEIEGTVDIGPKYADVYVARIVSARPVEDSDHLNLTLIDDGGVRDGVERDENGWVQVVCGAPNVREGMLVAWLPPGSTVPDSADDDEPFVLGVRKLRGYMSNGMLASARELALFDEHDGIVEIDKDVAPGTPFASVYALDDTLLDIENKSLTHRPDAFGVVGFAREVAAIAGKGFATPEWLLDLTPRLGPSGETYPLTTAVDNGDLSRRYSALVVAGIDRSAKTPLEIQTYLARSGVRPINAVVDVTNYLMLLSGQPLHAFDYDKVVALAGTPHLHVREAHANEKLELLDGRTIDLVPADIVIAAGSGEKDTAVALAGAMGGAATEIGADTTTIIIESATFDLYSLRATQMRHGIFSEAITRFTKGQPAELTMPVLARAAAMLAELTGGRVASHVADAWGDGTDGKSLTARPTIAVTPATVNGLLGTKFVTADIVETLRNVKFDVDATGETVAVTPPYWRTDIHAAEDVIEEIGRLNGFDTIEPVLPTRPFTAVAPDAYDRFRTRVRGLLSAGGANEVLSYSFVHGDLIKKAGQDPANAYALANAISPELQHYRLSLTPSLLSAVTPNIRAGFGEFALYEIGKVHAKDIPDENEPDLPAEAHRLAFAYAVDKKSAADRGSAYYTAKYYLEYLCRRLNVSGVVTYGQPADDALSAPFELKRTARVIIGGTTVGVIGEYRTAFAASLKLPAFCAGFELDLTALYGASATVGSYVPRSRYQGSAADVTFRVDGSVPYAAINESAATVLASSGYRYRLSPSSIYAPDATTKNVTLTIELSSRERTVTRDDVSAVVADVVAAVSAATGATVA